MLASQKHAPPEDMNVRIASECDDPLKPKGYRTFRCDTDSIKEALEEEVPYWRYWKAILIDAPPGKGKTSFVYEVLIPLAIKMNRNILLVANRNALSLQMKLDVLELIGSPLRDRLTDLGIRETDIFGSVGIVSYHSLPRFLNDPENEDWLDNVEYVVADECHYFTSDSSFNDLTEWHLKLITKHFKRAIRVYMTGTSWDVLRPIADAEMAIKYDKERACKVHLDREIIRYHWEQDHSHVDLRFFRDLEEIKRLILGNPNEKYMIFVDSRDSGRALADALGKDRATYLDADSKGTKEMTKLLKEQTFDRQVLVTTKVLDCGINLWDNRLRHIVTVTDDRVSMLQMLGRKRRKPGERVNLYVCDMDLKLIAKRYRDGQELLAALREYQEGDTEVHHQMTRSCWRSEDRKYRIYFRITDWSIVPNEVAFWALRRKDYFYRKLLEGHTTFRGEVCKWLGKTQEPEKIPDDELNAFCEAHLGQELNEEEIVMVRKRIVKTAEAKGFKEQQPTRVDTLGTEALNNRLSKVESPYRFEKKRWVILKEEKCDV